MTTLRTTKKYILQNPNDFKDKLTQWCCIFDDFLLLTSNNYPQKHSTFSFVAALGKQTELKTNGKTVFNDLKKYHNQTNDYIFGYISYDAKNTNPKLTSTNFDGLGFDDLYFFQPKKLFLIKDNILEIKYLNDYSFEIETDYQQILTTEIQSENYQNSIKINQRISKEKYVEKAKEFLQHIQRGDIYEANFCMEFFAENATINPLETYKKLNQKTEAPFAVYGKFGENYVICASPERYLRKESNTILSQPIKGTAKRFSDKILDDSAKNELKNNPKERSENIMIVDLVRNDLSKTATKNSVHVTELCEVYSFKTVHQLISTIQSTISESTDCVEVFETTFPMGSMTGAPKISAMQLIEQLEETKRGVYSGSIGYLTPEKNFDFNVVIRSVLYNSEKKYLSFSVGSALTSKAIPEAEYEECLLKAEAMREVLGEL